MYSFACQKNKHRGFSLIEAVVAIAIFLLFVLGVYGGIQLVFQIVYQSRLRILESALLNEQVEVIRNMSFYDVGIINGSPSGLLTRTATTTRSGVEFLISRTIRNIDDPFDGTIDGTPQDLSPADYKLVQIEVICTQCIQHEPLSTYTYVAPKYLEGDPNNGALFIEVFDAQAQPVQGASVHIVSTSTQPAYDFIDTTDIDGMLRLVDMAQGIGTYNITVSKDGYTVDQTYEQTEALPNPTKPSVSVIAQDVTEISFSIDAISRMTVTTQNSLCNAIGNVPFALRGTKLIGDNPNTYKVDNIYTTGIDGSYAFDLLEWDNYGFGITGYDLLGTIPDVPLALNPGVDQPVDLIIGPNTSNSLLIMATHNGQPIANASVHVTSNSGYNVTKNTGVGSIEQTDWSGGGDQEEYVESSRYFAKDAGVDDTIQSGNIQLIEIGGNYASNGWLESSTFDLGSEAEYVLIEWEPMAQPVEAGSLPIRFQLATSPLSTPETWEYIGPDGTASTYYTTDSVSINNIHNNDRFMRYKVYVHTDNPLVTPTLSHMSVTYTNRCTPPGQSYFGGLSAENYEVEITADGYQPYSTNVSVSGDIVVTAHLSQ